MFLRRNLGLSEDQSEEEMQYQKLSVYQNKFFEFMRNSVINDHSETEKYISETRIRGFCEKVDIDKDGKIDFHDLSTFLNRHNFMDNQHKRLIDTVKSVYGFDFSEKCGDKKTTEIYPVEPIDENKIGNILRDLRNALLSRNTSYHEFFAKLDSNKDGLITFNEFENGIKSVTSFSGPIIRGLFAYFDRQQIGMIDFNTFL